MKSNQSTKHIYTLHLSANANRGSGDGAVVTCPIPVWTDGWTTVRTTEGAAMRPDMLPILGGQNLGEQKLQCLEPQQHFQMRAKTNWYKPNSRKTLAFRLDVYNVFGGQIRSRKFNNYWSFEDVTLRHVWQEKTNNMILVRTIKVATIAKHDTCSCFQWCFMLQTLFFKTYTQPKPSCGISVCLSFINTNYVYPTGTTCRIDSRSWSLSKIKV